MELCMDCIYHVKIMELLNSIKRPFKYSHKLFIIIYLIAQFTTSCQLKGKIKPELLVFFNEEVLTQKVFINESLQYKPVDLLKEEVKLVIYIKNENLCNSCWFKELLFWNDVVVKYKLNTAKIMVIFQTAEIKEINSKVKLLGMKINVYYSLKNYSISLTKEVKKENHTNTFLVKNGQIRVVGSPIGNDWLLKKYLRFLKI